jgi:hypothetical protein
MALTIALEGRGVVATCDDLSDASGGSWSEVGGGTIEQSTDAYLVGSACIGGAYSNKAGRQQYDMNLTAWGTLDFSSGGAEDGQLLYLWINTSTIYLHETLANEGLSIMLMTSTTDYRKYIIAAGDDPNGWAGGWKCFVIDPTLPGSVSDTGTYDEGSIRYIAVDLDVTALVKGNNILIDMITCCSGLRVTGTSTTPWQDIVDYCNDFSNRAWGIVQEREGVFYVYGKIYFGDDSQTADQSFVESSGPVVKFGKSEYYYSSAWVISHPVDYAGIIIEDAVGYKTVFQDGVAVGSDQGRSGATFIGDLDIEVFVDLYGGNETGSDPSTTKLYGTRFVDLLGGITWGDDSDHLFYGGAVIGCGQFDPVGGVVIRNCIFVGTRDQYGSGEEYDGSALLWADSSVDIEDCQFIANADDDSGVDPHAVQHDEAGEYDYTNLLFSGNDYDVHFTAASGNLTINKLGTSNPTTSEVEGTGSVTFVSNPVTVLVTALTTGASPTPIQGARVLVLAADGAGPFPFEDAVSLAFSGGTVTVTHATHGMQTGDKVQILGATEEEYNGIHTITVSDASTYTYTIAGTPSTPDSGEATFVALHDTTDADGEAEATRVYTSDQNVVGRVRKSSGTPYYKTSDFVGAVDSANGLSVTVQMIKDE